MFPRSRVDLRAENFTESLSSPSPILIQGHAAAAQSPNPLATPCCARLTILYLQRYDNVVRPLPRSPLTRPHAPIAVVTITTVVLATQRCCRNGVGDITHARLPPLPCPFEPGRSSSAPSVSLRALRLVSPHPGHVFSSPGAHHPPRPCLFELERSSPTLDPCPFEPERSSPTSTASIRARMLVSHLDRAFSSLNAHLRVPEPQRSYPTSTVFLQARALVSYLHHALSSPNARLPPSPC